MLLILETVTDNIKVNVLIQFTSVPRDIYTITYKVMFETEKIHFGFHLPFLLCSIEKGNKEPRVLPSCRTGWMTCLYFMTFKS